MTGVCSHRLDVGALERTLQEIVNRHEVLRTRFESVNGTPKQIVEAVMPVGLEIVDLKDLSKQEREVRMQQKLREEASLAFDLKRGPLMRVRLLRLDDQEHVLLVTMHHIVSDGWSMGVLVREVGALYTAFVQGVTSPLAPLTVQYADFAMWQQEWLRGEALEEQLNYWKQRLKDMLVLQLPADRVRPGILSHAGATVSTYLSEELSKRLRELSRQERVTLFMVLLAGFDVLLGRYSGQQDIIVGSPIANRNRAEIEPLIGFFVNTLALRTDVSGNPSFRELLGRVREVCLGAYGHQDLPFEKLVEELHPERDLSRNPLFQITLALQNAPREELVLPGLRLQRLTGEGNIARFDQEWHVWEVGEQLNVMVLYSTDLFDRETVERMLRHYEQLLKGIVSNPEQRIQELPLLTEQERHQLIVEWNQTQLEYPRDKTITRNENAASSARFSNSFTETGSWTTLPISW